MARHSTVESERLDFRTSRDGLFLIGRNRASGELQINSVVGVSCGPDASSRAVRDTTDNCGMVMRPIVRKNRLAIELGRSGKNRRDRCGQKALDLRIEIKHEAPRLPWRCRFACPDAPIVSPALKVSFAPKASSVPVPARSSFTGGKPGIFADRARIPPAGSSSARLRSSFSARSSNVPQACRARRGDGHRSADSVPRGSPSEAAPEAVNRAATPITGSPSDSSRSRKSAICTFTGSSGRSG